MDTLACTMLTLIPTSKNNDQSLLYTRTYEKSITCLLYLLQYAFYVLCITFIIYCLCMICLSYVRYKFAPHTHSLPFFVPPQCATTCNMILTFTHGFSGTIRVVPHNHDLPPTATTTFSGLHDSPMCSIIMWEMQPPVPCHDISSSDE